MGRNRTATTLLSAEDMGTMLRRLRTSVDRFDANFQRTFDEYGRVESVRELLEDRVVPQFVVEEHSRVDFVDAFEQLSKRLQRFFDTKIRALRRLASAAEKATQKVDVDKVLGPTLGTERLCRAQISALNKSSVHNPNIWSQHGGRTKSGVHLALDVYICSDAVKRDFDWTGQAHIEQTMAENVQNDAALMRQYIGTYSGLTRIFPGFHRDVGPEQYSMDLFDPRFRPWFTTAESAPKDVLFLLDFSGSAKGLFVHLIKTSVMAVLQTLSPNDFFTGIWYNSRRDFVLANCTNPRVDTFLPANSRNKLLFRRFLDRLEERDQAVLPPAIEESFAQFVNANQKQQQNSSSNNNNDGTEVPPRRSGGHRLVLLFTDGVEFWPTDVVQHFQQRQQAEGWPPIRVFGHSIGHGRGAQPALAWLTCQTMAGLNQAEIGSVAEVRLKARAHLAKLSEVLALAYREHAATSKQRPISWTAPYMDVQKGGAVVSLSMPVLGAQPGIYRDLNLSRKKFADGNLHNAKLDGFIAVAGLDISFAELTRVMALDNAEDGTLAYAFLVDNNGIVYFHPRLTTREAGVFAVRRTMCHRISSTLLRSNTRVPFTKADQLVQQQMGYIDSIPHHDLLDLEPDIPLMRRFRARLVHRQCNFGNAPLEDAQRQLRCAAVNGTPLVVGFVLMKQRFRVSTSKHRQFQDEEDEAVDPAQIAERFKSILFELNGNRHEQKDIAKEGAEFATKNSNNSNGQSSVGILLSPGLIKQWELSAALSSAVHPLSRFRALIRLLTSLRHWDPFLAHLSALAPDSVFKAWASEWNSSSSAQRFSASSCTQRPLSPRIDSRMFRSAFLQFRTSSLRDKAALAAFFPRCELKSVQAFLQRTNLRQSLVDNGDDNEKINDGKLRIEMNMMADSSITDSTTLTVHKFIGVVDNLFPLVQIGVQLCASFFQQKFQRALQQHQNGWHECTNKAGRKCLLLSDSSVVLASSDPGSVLNTVAAAASDNVVVHLSNAEPELFAELLSRGFIQKVVWRDKEAQCPMAVTLDQRQMQRHQYLQQLHSAATSTFPDPSSAAATPTVYSVGLPTKLFSSFRQMVTSLPNALQWFGSFLCWWLLPIVSISAIDDDNTHHYGSHHQRHYHRQQQLRHLKFGLSSDSDCQFDNDQPTELMEKCTVEHTRYSLWARARDQSGTVRSDGFGMPNNDQSAVWMKDKQCNRTIALLPFARSHLFLLLIDGNCDKSAAMAPANAAQRRHNGADQRHGISLTKQLFFPQFTTQRQVPNCELARSSMGMARTLRPDLDYTLSHPKEFNPICSMNSAEHSKMIFVPCFPLFSIFIFSVLIFKDEFLCIRFDLLY